MLNKNSIKNDLISLIDEKYKEFHSNLCPGINNILGIRVPVLRNYAKQLAKNYSLEELLANIDDEYYEEVMLKGMIIGLTKNIEWEELEKHIREFVPKIDNWAICDTFCAGLKITKKYKKAMWKLIQEILKSSNEFEIRFAVVMILDYYIDEEYLEKNFEIFNQIKNDEYYVKMAIAWAISICFIKFYNETYSYLMNNKSLDNWTYNKAIQKAIESYRIIDKQKDELRQLKRR